MGHDPPLPRARRAWLPPTAALGGLLAGATVGMAKADPAVGHDTMDMHEVRAEAPSDLAVTIYRAPRRESGPINLDGLEGFALITETRSVQLPSGESRVRFEDVADGIEPASALMTGLPGVLVEKDREGALLSPAALAAATVGKQVELWRAKAGALERLPGTLVADVEGVVFQSAQGVEALHCSGLPETMSFTGRTSLAAHPTLSVLVRTLEPVKGQVTLSYLAHGFDWAANYSATLAIDGRTMDLCAWVTLANGNGVTFSQAETQVVAGRLNREESVEEPTDPGGPLLVACWPRGSTSDPPQLLSIAAPRKQSPNFMMPAALAAAEDLQEVVVTGARQVIEEQLGDLKLYRVPERTTVASRQSKQVRLLDRGNIPISIVYRADVTGGIENFTPAERLLRTRNSTANHLGLPLPSGQIAVFGLHHGQRLLEHESGLADLAIGEDLEISAGESADVQYRVVDERVTVDARSVHMIPLLPGWRLRTLEGQVGELERAEITNSRAAPIEVELRLELAAGEDVVRADHALYKRHGKPTFSLKIAAHSTAIVRYQTRQTTQSID
jgi:hypothetical protein